MGAVVLVVDDEVDVAEVIGRTLGRAGYEVRLAYRGAEALDIIRREHPDVIVLDWMMPGMSGVDVCRYIRANPDIAKTPVLFLTARADIRDKRAAYDALGDDYLTKPCDFEELELRVRALLRRSRGGDHVTPTDRVQVGDLVLDCISFEVRTPETSQMLTPVEFDLMQFLMSSPDRVFSAEQLLQEVWGYPPGTGLPDLVRVHVRNVRAKIEPDPSAPTYLRTKLRRGYLVSSGDRD